MTASLLATVSAHAQQASSTFKYSDERFADLQMLRYEVKDFDKLTLKQKTFIYYLQLAAMQGRDILFDQNGKYNLRIRYTLEKIYTDYKGDRKSADFKALEVYLKRVWFSNGIHHHYGCEKFVPGFSEDFFRKAARSVGADQYLKDICPVIFNPDLMQKRVNLAEGQDLVLTSASNYYDGVTQAEAEEF